MARTWSQIVEATAKKLELAALFNASVQFDAARSAWVAEVLRQMARVADRDARDRARVLGGFRLFGLKFTIARDG